MARTFALRSGGWFHFFYQQEIPAIRAQLDARAIISEVTARLGKLHPELEGKIAGRIDSFLARQESSYGAPMASYVDSLRRELARGKIAGI